MAKKTTESDSVQPAKKSGVLTNPIRNLTSTAVLCLILGTAFLALPYFVRDYCGFVIGGLLCAAGLVYTIIYFLRKPVSGIYRSEFASGLVILAAGIYVIVASLRPDATGVSITLRLIITALGVLIAVDGVMKLQYTLDMARMRYDAWWVGLFTSFLGLAIGVLIATGLVDDFGVRIHIGADDFLSAMLILGVSFIVNAALDLITVILVAVRNHAAAKAEAAAAKAAAESAAPEPASPYVSAVPAPAAPAPAPAPAAPAPAAPDPAPVAAAPDTTAPDSTN